MVSKAYTLDFDGYWREPNVSDLPKQSGIYGVYACTFDTAEKTVSVKRLLYIGEAVNVCDRVCAVTRRRFPVGANPTRQPLQPEATGAAVEVTK
jgi:hypothetical protein